MTETMLEQETKVFKEGAFLEYLVGIMIDQEVEESMEEKLTGRESLENLIEDDGFCERVWYDA